MIIKQTPMYRRSEPEKGTTLDGHYYKGLDGKKQRLAVCGSGLRQFFDVPEQASAMQFVLHNRPAKDRLPVTLRDGVAFSCSDAQYNTATPCPHPNATWLYGNKWENLATSCYLDRVFIRSLAEAGKPLNGVYYVEVWYEE